MRFLLKDNFEIMIKKKDNYSKMFPETKINIECRF